MALFSLDLIAHWHEWVHRRVETLTIEDPITIRRHVSVDFTLPARSRTPLAPVRAVPTFAVPLGLLRKRKLRHFDLRDESGRALPLLTASKNGAIAAAVLFAAAEVALGTNRPSDELPSELKENLWVIANSPREIALAAWEDIGRPRPSDSAEALGWRSALVVDIDFMALANDLARNFLVLVLLQAQPEQRRVIKFSYEEVERDLEAVIAQLRRQTRDHIPSVLTRKRRQGPQPKVPTQGVGLLVLTATYHHTDDETGEPAGEAPLAGLTFVIEGPDDFERTAVTNAEGRVLEQVPVGDYVVRELVPARLLERSENPQSCRVTAGQRAELRFDHLQIGTLATTFGLDPEPATPTLRRRLSRAVGWWSDRWVIVVPAIGQCSAYHLEIEAPEDLQVTKARLERRRSYWREDDGEKASEPDDEFDSETETQQRAHLYLSNVPPNRAGIAICHLRARPSTIIRAATVTTAITAVLLAAVAVFYEGIGSNVGSAAALLLLIPGGLSAYVARPREHPATTAHLFGLRIIALLPALFAFCAAITVVMSQQWSENEAGDRVAIGSWSGADDLVGVFAGLTVAAFLVLRRAWQRSAHPPEQRTGKGAAGSVSDPERSEPGPVPPRGDVESKPDER